jgi:hypothetical protein
MVMNSLQLWLAVLGGGVILGLLLHGAWQARRAGGSLRDPAPAPSRQQEPGFADVDTVLEDRRDSALPGDDGDEVDIPLFTTRRSAAVAHIDALIDAIASLTLDSPIAGEAVVAHLPASRRAGSKPFLIEGHNTRSGEWESPRAGAIYAELQAGVQLASRIGPINEIEYSEFIQKVQAFADVVNASADFPDMLDVVARGRELDTFAGTHDAQLAMRLGARRQAWPVATVNQHASRHGFVPGVTAGRLVLPARDDGAPPMLSLHYDPKAALADDLRVARVDEITLVFDVPQTAQSESPFNAWCAAGRALALSLDAVISDDEGRILPPESLPQVGQDLDALYERLAERDLAAGSAAARRLFS